MTVASDTAHISSRVRLARCGHRVCEDLRNKHLCMQCSELRCSALIAAKAREFVGHTLCSWRCWAVLDRAVPVVSELATNALLHGLAQGTTTARMYSDERCIWFEIDDPTDLAPKPRPPAGEIAEKADGWGLLLVNSLSDEFGWRTRQGGKTVFAGWLLP